MQPIFTGKRLLILGCGYLGGWVARQALVHHMQVTVLTRNAAQAEPLRAAGVAAVVTDLASSAWHRCVPPEQDYVLNCVSSGGGRRAGAALRSPRDDDSPVGDAARATTLAPYLQSYFAGMQSLVAWMAQAARVGTCVYTSSTGVYPQGQGAHVDEAAALAAAAPDTRAGILAATEATLSEGSAAQRWFILRLAGLYGPGRTHLLDQVRSGARVLSGSGTHRLNLIHVEDAAAAIWAAFSAPPSIANRAYNVADDAPAPKAALAGWLAAQLRQPPPRFAADEVGSTAAAPAPSPDPEPRHRIVPDRVILNARLKRELGWRPRYPSYREGYASLLSPWPRARSQIHRF